jgi:hypothetical protein
VAEVEEAVAADEGVAVAPGPPAAEAPGPPAAEAPGRLEAEVPARLEAEAACRRQALIAHRRSVRLAAAAAPHSCRADDRVSATGRRSCLVGGPTSAVGTGRRFRRCHRPVRTSAGGPA